MPEITVFSHKDNPVPGPSNISGHCLMYGSRHSVSCLMQAGCFLSILHGTLGKDAALGPGHAPVFSADVN